MKKRRETACRQGLGYVPPDLSLAPNSADSLLFIFG